MPEEETITTGENGTRERPISGIVRNVVSDMEGLVRAELRLAREELTEEARQAARAARPFSAAAIAGFFAAATLVACLIVCLAIVLPLWLAALLIAVVLGGTAGAAFLIGRMQMEKVEPVPQKTLETLKETVAWARLRAK